MALLLRRVMFNVGYGCPAATNYTVVRYKKRDVRSTLDEIQKERKNQAKRSVLFIHKSSKENLLRFCCNYGNIGSVHFFKRIDNQCALVEYSHISSAQQLIKTTRHFPNSKRIPFDSQCLHFSYNARNGSRQNVRHIPTFEDKPESNYITDAQLVRCSSVDSQMELLHTKQSLSELGVRLRYFIANEVESVFRKIFPQSESFLFGSSVTGLGRCDGDVDIVLDIEPNNQELDESTTSFRSAYFISKIRSTPDRNFNQDLLTSFGSMMRHLMPCFINVKPILRARIPIIKFKHSLADIEGDLCAGNKEAKEMASILFQLFQHHDSILPLIFSIRQWAKCSGVTKSTPGPHISNFMLTLLVIFYLQTHSQFLLPAIKNLHRSQSKLETLETISKEALLLGFFKFYAEMDFTNKGISVYEGTFIPKSDKNEDSLNPLYLENPLERHLNAAKNVFEPNLDKFRDSCAESYDILSNSPAPSPEAPWGLLKILTTHDIETDDDDDDDSKFIQEIGAPTNAEEILL